MRLGIAVVLLTLYSIAIIAIEYVMGATTARYYLTDISGPVVFYAVNTSLTTMLLALVIYNFVLCLDRSSIRRDRFLAGGWFIWSQIAIFGFLVLDERFMIHERLGGILGVNDAFILLGLGFIELFLLIKIGDIVWSKNPKSIAIVLAGFLFGIMIFIDAFLPSELTLRLSLEDLSKTWACFFLFVYSYYKMREIPALYQ